MLPFAGMTQIRFGGSTGGLSSQPGFGLPGLCNCPSHRIALTGEPTVGHPATARTIPTVSASHHRHTPGVEDFGVARTGRGGDTLTVTPAVDLLRRIGTVHRVLTYDHDPMAASYGLEAANALNLDPATVFKTLLAELSMGTASAGTEMVVAVVPVTGQLNLKSLAKAAGAKKATMADPTSAERRTGYVVGGISPLGQRQRLPTFIDESALAYDNIQVSGGRRGLEIELAPADLADVTGASFHSLALADATS